MSWFTNVLKGVVGTGLNSLTGGLINLGGSAAGSAISAAQQWKYQQRQNAWQEQQATTAYNRQVALLDKQNDYNTAANQVARLKEAGINPAQAAGGSSLQTVGATASSVPQANSSSVNTQGISFDSGSYANSFAANMSALADVDVKKANAHKLESDATAQDIDNEVRKDTLDWEKKSNRWQYEAHQYDVENSAANSKKIQNDSVISSYDKQIKAETYQSYINQQKARQEFDTAMDKKRLKNVDGLFKAEYNQAVETVEELRARVNLDNASASKMLQEALTQVSVRALNRALSTQAYSNAHNADADKTLKQLKAYREKIEQYFDFKNPVYGPNGTINFRGLAQALDKTMDLLTQFVPVKAVGKIADKFAKKGVVRSRPRPRRR